MIILILLQRNDKNLSLFANYKYIRGFEYKYGFLLTKIKPQKNESCNNWGN
jgi:hypothetical protein